MISKLLTLIRYRFLLFAGIFPYILGAVVSFHYKGMFDLFYFTVGFIGLIFVLLGVEVFNEYFDFKIGGDRVFLLHKQEIPVQYFKIGVLTFGIAFLVALYLTFTRGFPIMIFAIIGALSAIFYVAPPISFSYRGLGEIIIFLNYGPFMTLGSYYLQTQTIDLIIIAVSLIPGLLILSLCLINEIPDYYGDRLVGKKNIVVRLGKKKTVILYGITLLISYILLIILMIANRKFLILYMIFLTSILVVKNLLIAKENYEIPKTFIRAIRGTIFLYTTTMTLFIISFISK